MRIYMTSVFVEDQDKALDFYTQVLGFKKRADFPVGDYKWLTVAAPKGPEEVEMLLEPNNHPAARAFQEALVADGIPVKSFAVDDLQKEFSRLSDLGVRFTMPPTEMGEVMVAVFDDTCGNLIQLVQLPR